jgi:hypothetical protein
MQTTGLHVCRRKATSDWRSSGNSIRFACMAHDWRCRDMVSKAAYQPLFSALILATGFSFSKHRECPVQLPIAYH